MTPSFRPASARCGPRVVIARAASGPICVRSVRSSNHTGCANRADIAGASSTADSGRSTRSNAKAARPDRNTSASRCCKTSSPASEPAQPPTTNPHKPSSSSPPRRCRTTTRPSRCRRSVTVAGRDYGTRVLGHARVVMCVGSGFHNEHRSQLNLHCRAASRSGHADPDCDWVVCAGQLCDAMRVRCVLVVLTE